MTQRKRARHVPKQAESVFSEIREDIKALNSSIMIITQKMKYLVRNEKILGRNFLVLNRKLKALQEKVELGNGKGTTLAAEQLATIIERLDENNSKLAELEAELNQIKESFASVEQLNEIKYVIDSINPLELVTLEQVEELIDKKLKKKKSKK